ncbi:hypothetical protein PPIS_a2608 [Pseudoalteromonas piscicida]|uniref:Uncharacterized protein n=1 Tax=Pseudoalteromonas piscicida TaxID=43662 RepID=A0ABM6NFD5_PSEO7|nr:hypothetical protein PPIS_a2608 [Pseudoalteromonas piscicida]
MRNLRIFLNMGEIALFVNSSVPLKAANLPASTKQNYQHSSPPSSHPKVNCQ